MKIRKSGEGMKWKIETKFGKKRWGTCKMSWRSKCRWRKKRRRWKRKKKRWERRTKERNGGNIS